MMAVILCPCTEVFIIADLSLSQFSGVMSTKRMQRAMLLDRLKIHGLIKGRSIRFTFTTIMYQQFFLKKQLFAYDHIEKVCIGNYCFCEHSIKMNNKHIFQCHKCSTWLKIPRIHPHHPHKDSKLLLRNLNVFFSFTSCYSGKGDNLVLNFQNEVRHELCDVLETQLYIALELKFQR